MSDDDETRDEPTDESEPESYPPEVVRKLRDENAERRRELRAAEARLERLGRRALDLAVRDAARDVLADPTDLLHFTEAADLLDADREPDADKIAAAAAALVESRPHLAAKRALTGDVGQGPRGAPAPGDFDFAEVLRRAAGS